MRPDPIDQPRPLPHCAPAEEESIRVVILMGVSGSGKTTVGCALADALRWTFADADDFHPPRNVEKMRAGRPLSDADRQPWLEALRAFIEARLRDRAGAVVACSALKARYRKRLLAHSPDVLLVYLKGSRGTLRQRLSSRRGHFMPAALLDSQLAALEEPDPSDALVVDITDPPEALVARIRAALAPPPPAGPA